MEGAGSDNPERAVNEGAALARRAIQAAGASSLGDDSVIAPLPSRFDTADDMNDDLDFAARYEADLRRGAEADLGRQEDLRFAAQIRASAERVANKDNAPDPVVAVPAPEAAPVEPETVPTGRVLRSKSIPPKTPSKGQKRVAEDMHPGTSKRRTRSVVVDLFQSALDKEDENVKDGEDDADGADQKADDDDDPSLPLRVIPCLGCARKLARKNGLGTRCRRLTTSNRFPKRCLRCNRGGRPCMIRGFPPLVSLRIFC